MNCYQELCIYQQNGECLLKEIEINETGMCSCCICANIDKDILKKAKTELLIKFSK